MSKYKVRVYAASAWGFLTQADHFEDHYFESFETLQQIAKRLSRDGFQVGDKWFLPAAILTVEIER